MSYNAAESQLAFLGHLSKAAYQTVTYHCKNSVAWHDASANNHKKAMKFKGLCAWFFIENYDKSIHNQFFFKDFVYRIYDQ